MADHRAFCTVHGKIAYATVQEARRHLDAMRRSTPKRNRPVDGNLHPYRCPECRAWHLGRRFGRRP